MFVREMRNKKKLFYYLLEPRVRNYIIHHMSCPQSRFSAPFFVHFLGPRFANDFPCSLKTMRYSVETVSSNLNTRVLLGNDPNDRAHWEQEIGTCANH